MANESMRYDIVLGFKADVEAAKKQLYDLQQNIDRFTNRDFEINFNTKNLRAGYDDTSKQLIYLDLSFQYPNSWTWLSFFEVLLIDYLNLQYLL